VPSAGGLDFCYKRFGNAWGGRLRTFVAWSSLLDFFYRHLALLAHCHLFSRQATRHSNMLHTYSVVALRTCTFALSFEV
jgi:hypothetical protein